jgi:hypothetical protein
MILLTLFSCGKIVDVPSPATSISSDRVFSKDGNAIAALTGLYSNMPSTLTGSNGLSIYAGLSADEFTLSSGVPTSDRKFFFYTNNLSVYTSDASIDFWGILYNYIYNCNAAINGLTNSSSLTLAVRQQLLGESLFMRAFCYYYLVTLYGDVPLVQGTNYKSNALLGRTSTEKIWQGLITDLDSAQHLLSADYLDGSLLQSTVERVRPTKGAAIALLARSYIYTQNWEKAEQQASLLINNSSVYNLTSLQEVFLKNSPEAIWQLQPVLEGWNTLDAQAFIIPQTGLDNYINSVYLNKRLIDSIEVNDQRKNFWIDSVIVSGETYYYPYKYKSATYGDPVQEYQTVLRLGEQYLIRAEARAQQGNLEGARADLDIIRQRAGLSQTNARTKSELLAAILHERHIEMFAEFGQRWLDLKRTAAINDVMQIETPLKTNGSPWRPFQQLYPIPLAELQTNPNLAQNPGY